jgi:fatty acid desaturase
MAIWRHSRRDAILLGVSAAQLGLNLWLAATWAERAWLEVLGLVPIGVALFWHNAVVVTHNFIHTPWFGSEVANRVYATLDSLNLGVPFTLCRYHHLNHHRYVNDRRGPDGRTRDHSSTYRYGAGGAPEGALSYGLRGLFRSGTSEAWRAAVLAGHRARLLGELTVCGLGLVCYAMLSWGFVLCFLAPVFFMGSFFGILNNYYQHAGADPGAHSANSVSHYGRLYNRLCFNEGYHQEHHVRPGLHWSRRPRLRSTLPRAGRAISPVPPLLGFLAGPGGGSRAWVAARGAGGQPSPATPLRSWPPICLASSAWDART